MITFNEKEYDVRQVGGVTYAPIALQEELFDWYGYVSEEAEELDRQIKYYLTPEEMERLTDDFLTEFSKSL